MTQPIMIREPHRKKHETIYAESVRDMRRIYSDMSDEKFAKWYARKYKFNQAAVLTVLRKQQRGGEKQNAAK